LKVTVSDATKDPSAPIPVNVTALRSDENTPERRTRQLLKPIQVRVLMGALLIT
jgi:hypothetical protein